MLLLSASAPISLTTVCVNIPHQWQTWMSSAALMPWTRIPFLIHISCHPTPTHHHKTRFVYHKRKVCKKKFLRIFQILKLNHTPCLERRTVSRGMEHFQKWWPPWVSVPSPWLYSLQQPFLPPRIFFWSRLLKPIHGGGSMEKNASYIND